MIKLVCAIFHPKFAYTSLAILLIGQTHAMSSFDFNRQQMQVSAWYTSVMAIFLCQTAANFGTLTRSNALGNMEVPEELTESLWCDIITSIAGFPF